MAASRGTIAALALFSLHCGAPPPRVPHSEGAAFRGEVIRFPTGQDHDTNCITRFSTEWRRRAAVYSRAKELERQGRSIIHLELGEPDFHPAAPVVDALR